MTSISKVWIFLILVIMFDLLVLRGEYVPLLEMLFIGTVFGAFTEAMWPSLPENQRVHRSTGTGVDTHEHMPIKK